jgi:hypothetical protein
MMTNHCEPTTRIITRKVRSEKMRMREHPGSSKIEAHTTDVVRQEKNYRIRNLWEWKQVLPLLFTKEQ